MHGQNHFKFTTVCCPINHEKSRFVWIITVPFRRNMGQENTKFANIFRNLHTYSLLPLSSLVFLHPKSSISKSFTSAVISLYFSARFSDILLCIEFVHITFCDAVTCGDSFTLLYSVGAVNESSALKRISTPSAPFWSPGVPLSEQHTSCRSCEPTPEHQ